MIESKIESKIELNNESNIESKIDSMIISEREIIPEDDNVDFSTVPSTVPTSTRINKFNRIKSAPQMESPNEYMDYTDTKQDDDGPSDTEEDTSRVYSLSEDNIETDIKEEVFRWYVVGNFYKDLYGIKNWDMSNVPDCEMQWSDEKKQYSYIMESTIDGTYSWKVAQNREWKTNYGISDTGLPKQKGLNLTVHFKKGKRYMFIYKPKKCIKVVNLKKIM